MQRLVANPDLMINILQNAIKKMDLITPGVGLIFWTVVIFSLLLLILRAFAWKPVLNAVKTREERIRAAIKSAERAKEEMERLKADNEKIFQEARDERDEILRQARDDKNRIIQEAREKAELEANKLIEHARLIIQSEKETAITQIQKQIAELSVNIAEKILRKNLESDKTQKELIDRMMKDIKLS